MKPLTRRVCCNDGDVDKTTAGKPGGRWQLCDRKNEPWELIADKDLTLKAKESRKRGMGKPADLIDIKDEGGWGG